MRQLPSPGRVVDGLAVDPKKPGDFIGRQALRRIKAATVEKRLVNSRGEPNFGINFYMLNKLGEHAGVAMYGGPNVKYAICTENGPQLLPCEPLLQGPATD